MCVCVCVCVWPRMCVYTYITVGFCMYVVRRVYRCICMYVYMSYKLHLQNL